MYVAKCVFNDIRTKIEVTDMSRNWKLVLLKTGVQITVQYKLFCIILIYINLFSSPEALTDLNQALELCAAQPRTKCTALCQRGVLYRKQNNLDAARRDFEDAAELGSEFAKSQVKIYFQILSQPLCDIHIFTCILHTERILEQIIT